jgi:hypothetical protein
LIHITFEEARQHHAHDDQSDEHQRRGRHGAQQRNDHDGAHALARLGGAPAPVAKGQRLGIRKRAEPRNAQELEQPAHD